MCFSYLDIATDNDTFQAIIAIRTDAFVNANVDMSFHDDRKYWFPRQNWKKAYPALQLLG
jgi:hypothetical protein